jgi:hypothetical protein
LIYLIAASVAPIAGPLLYRVLHGHPKAVRLVDGSVYLAVPALLAWQVGHLALEQSTLLVLSAAAAGLAVPSLAEQISHALHRHTDKLALIMGVSGLVLHALLEGAALASGETGVDLAFGLAIVPKLPSAVKPIVATSASSNSGTSVAGAVSRALGDASGSACVAVTARRSCRG